MSHCNLNTHNLVFCIFLSRTLSNFNKLSVIIVICNKKLTNWPYKQYHVNTSRCFLSFFHMQKKLKTFRNLNLRDLEYHIWGIIYLCDIYIVSTRAFDSTQLYICYKFYPTKQTFWSAIQVKHSYITKPVLYFTKCWIFYLKFS